MFIYGEMSAFKKQHIVPKTYLKHFSANSDGKGLFIIDSKDEYNKGIQKKNSGDRVFWIKNYSDTDFFVDKKAIEKMFAYSIEKEYNKIISAVSEENPNINFDIKQELLGWLFYTKQRSVIWENHIKNFTDHENFIKALNEFLSSTLNMKWTIYKSPQNHYWLTSDNPGFCLDLKMYKTEGKVTPTPFWDMTGVDSVLFYPLSKNYCLTIHPYDLGEDLNLNLTNTKVSFEEVEVGVLNVLNCSTCISRKTLIISTVFESINGIEKLCNIPQ